jgi:adenylate kinase|tara:strand:- start:601 stop:1200 length:600 start_codon:yes stop_codon:yes gene_type:complete
MNYNSSTSFPDVIGITGTPGTGKKTIGCKLAEQINYEFCNINQIILDNEYFTSKDSSSYVVDIAKLKNHLADNFNSNKIIISGHLLPEVLGSNKVDQVIILRCSPLVLWSRLSSRDYSLNKIKDNVESELLDLCLFDSINSFGSDKLLEFNNTEKNPSIVVSELITIMLSDSSTSTSGIDWLTSLSSSDLFKLESHLYE